MRFFPCVTNTQAYQRKLEKWKLGRIDSWLSTCLLHVKRWQQVHVVVCQPSYHLGCQFDSTLAGFGWKNVDPTWQVTRINFLQCCSKLVTNAAYFCTILWNSTRSPSKACVIENEKERLFLQKRKPWFFSKTIFCVA